MNKETSAAVSGIASNFLGINLATLLARIDKNPDLLISNIKTIAASALSQDETPGQIDAPERGGIHPAPLEFTEAQIAADPILHFFHYAHLPPTLQIASVQFFRLAYFVVMNLPRNAERTVALRKLLEAKDAAVRANLPARSFDEEWKQRNAAKEKADRKLGEPIETGGHDEDRDGPIPFSS